MLNLVIAIGAMVGGSYNTEMPVSWPTMLRIIQRTESQWMEYYKTGRAPAAIGEGTNSLPARIQFSPLLPGPNLNWAVPNNMLPQGPPLQIYPPFPDYEAHTPGTR